MAVGDEVPDLSRETAADEQVQFMLDEDAEAEDQVHRQSGGQGLVALLGQQQQPALPAPHLLLLVLHCVLFVRAMLVDVYRPFLLLLRIGLQVGRVG